MDFFNNIVEQGFSVKCFYGDDEYLQNKGFFKINVNNEITIPDELTDLDKLLIATIAVHFVNDVDDVFNYDNTHNVGEFYINNKKYTISLPLDLQSLFYMNNEYNIISDDVTTADEDSIPVEPSNSQIELFNKILGHIKTLENDNYLYEDKFFKFKIMNHQTNDIVVIRNNTRVNIGIGKIFTKY
jgi:hypothetical protein